ncbi:hypothetical protein [Helicobacter canis]|uniref:hypothetical protein n=1 Tax=Helicobacter canis TaxID=29419 RepID=UPI0011C06570|nr:hypothetical protein [Helicobacter canis]
MTPNTATISKKTHHSISLNQFHTRILAYLYCKSAYAQVDLTQDYTQTLARAIALKSGGGGDNLSA